jgi:CRISPR-associated protein (TIGR02710 family)
VNEPEQSTHCRAMLVSLGGSPAPVLYTLNQQQPAYVLFFVSPQSEAELQTVINGLDFRCTFGIITSSSAEDLGACYRALRGQLPARLAQWSITEGDLVVDYTGGTKSMSAALVLATVERIHRYSYVGGVERDKQGMGVVIGGRERMLRVHNPWREWGEEERKRIGLYFATARYDTALQELQRLLAHVEPQERGFLGAIANAIEGYRDWDNFNHARARTRLDRALNFFEPYRWGAHQTESARFVQDMQVNQAFLERLLEDETRDQAYILDVLANADRRARIEGKYEDAVARLYSALERGAKFRLKRQHGIRTDDVEPEQIPEVLREEYLHRYHDTRDEKVKVPLLAAYRLLDALGDDLGSAFMARQDDMVQLLSLRNQSPLGHGETPVGAAGYRRFRALLVALLGIDEAALPHFPALWV